MSISSPFISRPVATILLTSAIAMAGVLGYRLLPVSPLPQVDFPTIQVSGTLPGASPETMASSVATPLERQFGRIAGLNEMTSTSYLGTTSVTMQFDLTRNVDAAARDVQAAINAARGQLPANLPNNPTWRKVNPADAPVMIIALTSDTQSQGQMYDAASSILSQKLAQIQGVGQVSVGGSALPGVRVDVNPTKLNEMGLGLEDVRMALAAANANTPKGEVTSGYRSYTLSTTDQLLKAKYYTPLIVAFRNGAAVRVSDVATATDSVEDLRNLGLSSGKRAVLIIVFRQPGANIIDTVDRVMAALPQLQAVISQAIKLDVVLDRTVTIRASVKEVQITLLISIGLVILVVFAFLRDWRTTLIPSVVVPVSLTGTFGVMYLAGYSLDNLSLMALTISTGFVVDDAIVVIENITRYLEQGMKPMEAALKGAAEIGSTVISMTLSLVAVFLPILLMGGIVGRLFREFAVTLSAAILLSMSISLTATPMMCALLLRHVKEEAHGRIYRASEWVFDRILGTYDAILKRVLRHQAITLLITLGTIGLTVFLYFKVPKGFFPQQDTGRLQGAILADQSISFQAMEGELERISREVLKDPAAVNVIEFTGGSGGGGSAVNSGRMFITLKPLDERKLSADEVIARIRSRLSGQAGATLFLQATQDLRLGGRQSNAQYQYTFQDSNLSELNEWAPKMLTKMQSLPGLADLSTDQQNHGLSAGLQIDRLTASRLGVNPQNLDDTLYDAFGQRQVSIMYTPLNQYHVVMEVEPKFWQSPDGLKHIYVGGANQTQVPLSTVTKYAPSTAPLAVNHQGQIPSVTFSFNLMPGVSLGDAVDRIDAAEKELGLPSSVQTSYQGAAQAYQDSLSSEPVLVMAAIFSVYIVLGMLYESFIHPITIISTIPSAGVGALLALLLTHIELSVISLIGIILLIGIVKKNAILMIDFAISEERVAKKAPEEAIYQACLLRFRPIMMTTMAALLGGVPLAIGMGVGSELRRPLGVAIVGGLILSQMLTLFTTPVIYLYLDRFQSRIARWRGRAAEGGTPQVVEA
jgi:multidrug efflux pump